MINQYPWWKYALIIVIVVIGAIYALPNLYGDDPAVQISKSNSAQVGQQAVQKVRQTLKKQNIRYKSITQGKGRVLVRFYDTDAQLQAKDDLNVALGMPYVVALNLAPRTPGWLRAIGAKPMSLGLDLRGGVHFLMQVDMKAALKQAADNYRNEIRHLLRKKGLRYTSVEVKGEAVHVTMRSAGDVSAASSAIGAEYQGLQVQQASGSGHELVAQMTQKKRNSLEEFAIKQNLTTLRNRVNELGVSSPVIQQEGKDRIVVELPGVQDTARAKDILGATATLQFHLVDESGNPQAAEQSGQVPLGDELYKTRDGRPVLLKRDVIVTGNELTDAHSGIDNQSGTPAVFVTLDGKGASRMGKVTRNNIGHAMAVLFIERKTETEHRYGKAVQVHHTSKRVISIATIRGAFSKRFMITGLASQEAHNLALLLRAGALAAPIDIVQERTVGPSMGRQNIHQGFMATVIGFLLVVAFMVVYYGVFGLIADVALFLNLVLLVALLSMLQATLTLPGIAGIVLTVGMAVDANVLIFERIREELFNGNTPQASIHAGYEKALSSIADGNITTLIAAVVLFSFGSGPVKGFAVTLSIGILASMFTAIMVTRAIVNQLYGGRTVKKLSV
ncbi:MAG TPA: protein translocase subunit SecD [Gammaproteobacteria bacterium]|nr:protein translocase subunit SecD [Gammaproteobacteria bacterium]